jgi:hypothetical protein
MTNQVVITGALILWKLIIVKQISFFYGCGYRNQLKENIKT